MRTAYHHRIDFIAMRSIPGLNKLISSIASCADNLLDALFERKSPAFVILYLSLFGAAFWAYSLLFFPLLPLPGVPAWHMCVSSASFSKRA